MKKILLWMLGCAALTAGAQTKNISGDYSGSIVIPGNPLQIILHLQEDDRRLSGTIDIPQQNANGLKLDQIKYNKGELSFTLPDVPGGASFKGVWKDMVDSITGTFTQGGANLPMLLKKISVEEQESKKQKTALQIEKIKTYLEKAVKDGRMAGMAVAIVKDNEIILNQGFGYRDVENKIACDENTLFAIGSCTKAFTATVLATLHDEGLFDWETPVNNYISYFGMKDEFANKQINGIDICTHRSGLPRHDLIWYGSDKTRKELVSAIRYMEPNKPFRTTWQYNNFMFLTAGVVAEEITQKTWEDLVQERIFNALGMKNSKIHFNDFTNSTNRSLGYEESEKNIKPMPYRNIDAMGPAGSIFSTSTDMAQWVKLFLNKGKVGDKALVSEEQIKFLTAPKVVMDNPSDVFKQMSYAMGWMVSQYKGKTYIEHGGNIDGFTASVTLFPEENLGFVILSNKNGSSIPATLGLYIIDQLSGEKEYDWMGEKIIKPREKTEAEEIEKRKEKEKSKSSQIKKAPSHELSAYIGEYTDPAYGTAKIYMENKKLKFKYNMFDLDLVHDAFETFKITYDGSDMKVCFFTGPTGKVEWFQMQLEASTKAVTFSKNTPDYLKDSKYISSICGDYDLDEMTITLYMDKNNLMAKSNDGQNFELVPSGENMFKIKEVEGFNMEFFFDEKGNCIKLISHQPNGDFEGIRKKK